MILDVAGKEAYEYHTVNILAGEQKGEAYQKINSRGQVPALVEEGFSLTEGAAILQHVAESRQLADWYPTEAQARARTNEWLHWVHGAIRRSSTMGLLVPKVIQQKEPAEEALPAFKKHLDLLEAHLAASKFLVGDKPTIADLFVVPEVDQIRLFAIYDFAAHPHVARWLADLEAAVPAYGADLSRVRAAQAAAAAAAKK